MLLRRHKKKSTAKRYAAAAMLAGWAAGATSPLAEAQVAEIPRTDSTFADGQGAQATRPITVLSFDLSSVPGAAPSRLVVNSPAWRTTFGSERHSAPARPITGGLAGADIVLLHGIGDMKTVRQWFPAREWKLVVSRQLLISDDPLETWSRDGIAAVPTTGIAVRYQAGMRVTAQDHLLELARSSGNSPPVVQPAGTAIRVQLAGQIVWALSLHLPPACIDGPHPCPENDATSRWWQSKKEAGLTLLTGGRFHDPQNSALGPCAHQIVRVEPAVNSASVIITQATPEPETGCTARVTIPGTRAPLPGR